MELELLEFMKKETEKLKNAPTCCAEAKAVAQAWLNALGTSEEDTALQQYLEELKADIMPIDTLIDFAGSEAGRQYFGTDTAQHIVAHSHEIKAAGAKYCDCPACAAAEAILKRNHLL